MLMRQKVKAKVLRGEGAQIIAISKISMVQKPVATELDLKDGRKRNQFTSSNLSNRPAGPLRVQ